MNTKSNSRREFSLTSLSIGNRTTVFVLIALITFSGLYSYITVPKESFPEIIIPEIFVVTAYPGNSPSNMEKLITRPIEKEINAISGVDEIISSSSQGFSTIDVKFTFDVSPTEALRKVKDAVDKVKSDADFPKDLRLVWRQVDHAVRRDDIGGAVLERNRFEKPAAKLHDVPAERVGDL